MAGKVTVLRAIAEYDAAYRALSHHEIPSGPAWDIDVRRVDDLGRALLQFKCGTRRQFGRWLMYVRSVPDLNSQVSHDLARELSAKVNEAVAREAPAPPSYEFGIEGSDRVSVSPPTGTWNRNKKRYPLDLMEVGETIFLPGIKRRAQVGPALVDAQRRHDRKFTTKAEDGGLRIRRTA